MSGLALFFVGLLWTAAAGGLAYASTAAIRLPFLRILATTVVLVTVLPLPLVDEIAGAQEFRKLCGERASVQVNRHNAFGKVVYLAESHVKRIPGTWVPVVSKPWLFLDVNTREPVVSYVVLEAEGGWLVRSLGIFEGGVPLTFKGSCEVGGVTDPVKLLNELGVIQVQRSTLIQR